MNKKSSRPSVLRRFRRRLLGAVACALILPCMALTSGAAGSTADRSAAPPVLAAVGAAAGPGAGQPGAGPKAPIASATLEQCVTSVSQAERSATFSGEMSALTGSAHLQMQMRIDVLERLPAELRFRVVSAPGLGAWRVAAPGVKVFKSLEKVTNLSAPAFYRAAARFRWLNAKGRLVRAAERRTATCEQPAAPAS